MSRRDEKTEEQLAEQKARHEVVLHEAKRLWLLLPGIMAIVLVILARQDADACEQLFSQGIYPWISSAVAFLPGFVSISVAQWFVIIACALILIMIVHYIVRIVRTKGMRLRYLYRFVMSVLGVASFALFFYTILCGLNYYRLTFAENEGFEVAPSTTTELVDLCDELADELNGTRAELSGSIDDYIDAHGGFSGYAVRSVREFETLAIRFSTLERPYYSQPKPVTIFAELMSDADITGMFFAYTVESNVNVQPKFYTIPATMAHELAHQCGYMREDEANFIAYLACSQSGDALIRYSGYSLAYSYAISALSRVDESAARTITAKLSGEVRADQIENSRFWAEHDGAFRTFAQQANDLYLKANDQQDGTQSYGRVVDLLLAERRGNAATTTEAPATNAE